MSPKRLTLAQRLQVACYHATFARWEFDPTVRHSVCCHCKKPSPDTVLRNCSECDDEFVMALDWKWLSKWVKISTGQMVLRNVLCPRCNGD